MTVFIIAALSADGFLAPNQPSAISHQPSTHWTSAEDTQWFSQKTREAGIVIMGRTTWETIPDKYKPLKNRLNIIYTSAPEKVSGAVDIFAINLKPETSNLKPVTTSLPPQQLINQLTISHQPSAIAIIGGSSIYTQFMQAGVVDKLYLTIEPILFGQGIPLFDKPIDTKLHLDSIHDLSDQTKVLEYSVIR